jgi:hypothetical protein
MQAQRDVASRFSEGLAVDGHDEQGVENCDIIEITEEVLSQRALEQSQSRYRYRQVLRNASIIFSHRETSLYKFGDIDLKPGTYVELREPSGNWEVSGVRTIAGHGCY